jgi:hypothetical protein
MPNIENLESKPLTHKDRTLEVRRHEILYREDIKTSFAYALVGIGAVLGLTGIVYVVGKQLLKN